MYIQSKFVFFFVFLNGCRMQLNFTTLQFLQWKPVSSLFCKSCVFSSLLINVKKKVFLIQLLY